MWYPTRVEEKYMPGKKVRKKKSRKKPEVIHETLSIIINAYEICSNAGVNHDVVSPEYAFNLDLDDPLYEAKTQLTIEGTGQYPRDREGHKFEVTIYGDDAPSRLMDLQLKDVQERDKYGSPKYRSYRKQELPVFKDINGMALLSKVRGENAWTAWINVAPRAVTDMLLVLREERTRYLSIHEVKEARNRWIRSIRVQTTDPMDE